MTETTVESVYDPVRVTVSHEATVTEAAWVLRDPRVGAAIVTDETGVVVGIVTESDVVAAVAETDASPSITAVMSTPVVTTPPSTSVATAAETMRGNGIKHLPVVDDGACEGLVSAATLARHLPDRLDIEWQDEPLTIEDAGESARSASD